ncbi:uncharacterized protein LOC143218639 isoform X3 [Lasioglossum baleicum]
MQPRWYNQGYSQQHTTNKVLPRTQSARYNQQDAANEVQPRIQSTRYKQQSTTKSTFNKVQRGTQSARYNRVNLQLLILYVQSTVTHLVCTKYSYYKNQQRTRKWYNQQL